MKIIIISFGKESDANLVDAIDDFTERLSHWTDIEWKVLPASRDEGGKGRQDEAIDLLRFIDDNDTLVALDERGKKMTSQKLSEFFDRSMVSGEKRIIFVIGGSYGLHHDVLSRADMTLSLSDMTLPHQIVRLVLIEQVYRAFSILKGSKYHHA
ncbi:MAG: 23S rRNA (pseudouridine(1915)-N(3))-methyltransferase RlmH [Candidatus Taylorbacteria bacterium CG10_big_fil_rev_8_21_14_0_10_41_48]|uniref:Ribosomal RNA large subunit methyltransferase H n=1 Tax=Candidatus Taylorbacteria bacterium CG10_big_fil_rev_8_21_14_0_10_41_48 TaxID=1975024 RepID=A0A2M8LD60_9BACT|nr:MAG: 23S rRNA (pseudouridine(1915)-N(3))-methyltransferase RlmH [Candidatus Taylorbacteria bacterium CG10_big_fil_rev_8_21_14_0_10_41_48]